MTKVQLTLKGGSPLTVYYNSNFAVNDTKEGVRLVDGLHNNGGWWLEGTYEEVIAKIDEALKNT
mgnify:CR=1 FL=1